MSLGLKHSEAIHSISLFTAHLRSFVAAGET